MLSAVQVETFAFDTGLLQSSVEELPAVGWDGGATNCLSNNSSPSAINRPSFSSSFLCYNENANCTDFSPDQFEMVEKSLGDGWTVFCFIYHCVLNDTAQIDCTGEKTYFTLAPSTTCDIFLDRDIALIATSAAAVAAIIIALCTFFAGFKLGFANHAKRLRKEFAKLRSMSKHLELGAHVNQAYNGLPSQFEPETAVTTLRSRVHRRKSLPESSSRTGSVPQMNNQVSKSPGYFSNDVSAGRNSEVGSYYQQNFPTLYDLAGGFSTMTTFLDSTFDFTTTQTLTINERSKENIYTDTASAPTMDDLRGTGYIPEDENSGISGGQETYPQNAPQNSTFSNSLQVNTMTPELSKEDIFFI